MADKTKPDQHQWLTVHMHKNVYAGLHALAARRGFDVSELAEMAIKHWVEKANSADREAAVRNYTREVRA